MVSSPVVVEEKLVVCIQSFQDQLLHLWAYEKGLDKIPKGITVPVSGFSEVL